MLDILNPCNDPNAWWQQLLMLAGPLLLGYLWGKGRGTADVDTGASARLAALDADLADCRNKTRATEANITASIKANSLTADGGGAAAKVSAAPKASAGKAKKDDLKVVEGIGPKIESIFNEAGITTFAELANTSAARLKEILEGAGSRFQMHDPTTWPAQSKLADEGKWEELKRWQDELNKGQAE